MFKEIILICLYCVNTLIVKLGFFDNNSNSFGNMLTLIYNFF